MSVIASVAMAAGRPPVRASSRSRMRDVVPLVVVALACALVAIRRAESAYSDTDILWGIRSGLDVLHGHGLPQRDIYSWTASGRQWIPNSWAWNVLLGLAFRVAGYVGVAIVGITFLAGTGALLGVAVRRAGGTAAWGALTAQVLLGLFALFLYPRAQLADYAAVVCLPLLTATALGSSPGRRAVGMSLGVIAVQIAWMNLHTAAVLGPLIVLAVGCGRVLHAQRRASPVRVAMLVIGTSLACLATPYGVAPLTHLSGVRNASIGLIAEWRPPGLGSAEQVLALVAIAIGVLAGIICLRRRAYDTLALLVLFAALTATALRFAPMLVLTAIPPLAAAAKAIPARAAFMNRVCSAGLLVLALLCTVFIGRFASPGAANTSPRLVADLPHGCRLVNDMTVGGAVILQRPDVLVSIDSRNDMYGRQSELTSLRVLTDADFGSRYVASNKVTCVLAPSGTALVRELASRSTWRTVAHDSTRTLLVLAGVE